MKTSMPQENALWEPSRYVGSNPLLLKEMAFIFLFVFSIWMDLSCRSSLLKKCSGTPILTILFLDLWAFKQPFTWYVHMGK